MHDTADIPDWRRAEDYRWLEGCSRAAFAWEWLRRQAAYRRAWEESRGSLDLEKGIAGLWNLHSFEDPRFTSTNARPMWTREAFPFVLEARARRCCSLDDCFDFTCLGHLMTRACDSHCEHLLISNGCHFLRVDVFGRSVGCGPVSLEFRLSGLKVLSAPLTALRQLRSLTLNGAFAASLHPSERRGRRMVMLLRAFDALAAGASQKEIADQLLVAVPQQRWRTLAPSLRGQAQRLVKGARIYAAGRFWNLLQS